MIVSDSLDLQHLEAKTRKRWAGLYVVCTCGFGHEHDPKEPLCGFNLFRQLSPK